MGTNYYLIKKKNKANKELEEKKEKIISYVKDNEFTVAQEALEELCNDYDCGIHIGKKSCGWRFLFDHNREKYYTSTRKSIEDFIKNNDLDIKDEYGHIISYDEFWKMVDDSMLDPDNIGNREYDEEEARDGRYQYCYHSYPDKEVAGKYNISHSEYYNDGLRFSDRTDFC